MMLFNQAPTLQAFLERARIPFLRLLFITFFTLAVAANLSQAQEDEDIEVVRVRTDLVTVPAFVTDGRGARVRNLVATDFELRDDGRVVNIEYFAAGTEHVALLFALDVSGSTREVIGQQRETALALFSRFGQGSEVAVMRFADRAELIAPFSGAQDAALAAFNVPIIGERRTAIFDAAARAVESFAARRGDPAERRIVILISDGLDTISTKRPREVIEAAKARAVSFYSLQVPLYAPRDGRLRPRPATKGFRELAEQTGGRFFLAGDAKEALTPGALPDLSEIFRAIEDDLQGQYVLGYYPGETADDGRTHRLTLNLTTKEKRKLRVRLVRDAYRLSDNR